MDRIHRSNNVIVRGIPEIDGETNAQKQADEQTVMSLIKSVIPNDQEFRVISITRLGKATPGRSRLSKVVLDSPATVKKLVRHRFNNGIFFNMDLTQYQQNKAYTVRTEFKRRRESGEENIRLRYHNGIPKIVTAKNN